MDFRHLIVTCLFSMLRLSFENQKNKKNYAIFSKKTTNFFKNILIFLPLTKFRQPLYFVEIQTL